MKNKTLALQVKSLRKKNGFSQEELAETSGLSLRTIQRIENGETESRGDTLKRLATTLNVTPDELVDWTVKEDNGYLQALNLSAFAFLFFPLLGILIPFIMWVAKKDKIKSLNKSAKSLVNFQITWCLVLFTPFILFFTNVHFGVFRQFMLFHLTLYVFNFVMILVNSYRIHKEKEVKFFPKINFLRP
ncbi:DUF4870 domain-containing protein [uncultured Algibacter sp.]|uniref:DUF4870 domain-containing protein n=1 Tax=uncultured Algibacter sp. TaxID=298659 RepID=UPI00261F056C|nr:DUF4870 domain-containing protein [uncultured Algibacter sp.]